MAIVQNLMERLRPLVGLKGWDYCVLWKLSDDQRFLEWIDCCCAGTDQTSTQNDGEELHFPVSPVLPCRDLSFQHPVRTKSCELLSQLSTSIPLDSGIYAQTLTSNQPRWLNFSTTSDSDAMEGTVWTRVLIPVVGGLIELFVTKEVPEDQHVIDFIAVQCSISMEQEAMINMSNNMEATSSANNVNEMNELQRPFLAGHGNGLIKDHSNNHNFQAQGLETMDGPYDMSVDRMRICSSPIHFLQQFNENKPGNEVFFEGSPHDFSFLSDNNKQMGSSFHASSQNGIVEMDALTNSGAIKNMHMQFMESNNLENDRELQQGENNDKDSIKHENGPSDSISDCSDQIDDEDDVKYNNRRRNGKGPSKNLVAERNRRKKLNHRLYALRALVPKISKLDRASILVDAIDFVKELQQQAKELQDELEDNWDDDGTKNNAGNNVKSESLSQNGMILGRKTGHDKASNGFHMSNGSVPKQDQDSEHPNDKGQQMEGQVEVAQLDGNEFFVMVFCEHKPGGFVRLIEALNSLGLEVTNANVTSNRGLVSNVFKVKKRDSEMVQADHVRESLLELTRNPCRRWPENMVKANSESIDNNGTEYQQQQQHHHDNHLHNHHISSHHHHHHHLHHLHN